MHLSIDVMEIVSHQAELYRYLAYVTFQHRYAPLYVCGAVFVSDGLCSNLVLIKSCYLYLRSVYNYRAAVSHQYGAVYSCQVYAVSLVNRALPCSAIAYDEFIRLAFAAVNRSPLALSPVFETAFAAS